MVGTTSALGRVCQEKIVKTTKRLSNILKPNQKTFLSKCSSIETVGLKEMNSKRIYNIFQTTKG